MKKEPKINKILLLIVVVLLIVMSAYIFSLNSKKLKEDMTINKTQQAKKETSMEGYIYRGDISSEMMRGNSYINLRNIPNMEGNSGAFSLKIENENIRNLLIDKYNTDNSEWIKVKITGVSRLVSLPINGASLESSYIEVNTLIIK